jgi:hypothetical protein
VGTGKLSRVIGPGIVHHDHSPFLGRFQLAHYLDDCGLFIVSWDNEGDIRGSG